ncbi:hypothetical protein [Brevibacillus daliensis]|uniref:hypothetical protein n=1 Tax=Brevibacillus daliensis TaxID=2892995 RepID=UPI001E646239|nr:hypothetical protein [Brevibacillus daliensis]
MTSNMLQKGMFLYAWTVNDLGIPKILEEFQQTGCNAVVLNSSYHQGRFFQPRQESFYASTHAGIFFTPTLSAYERIKPVVHEEIAKTELFPRMREACEENGFHFTTWWVGLHNSALGRKHPELCVQNVWQDPYTYALCPAQPDVQQYAISLFTDTLQVVQPQRILVETAAFMTMKHGGHHEIMLLHMGEAVQWLLSLCFCPCCKLQAEKSGVDADAVQALVKRLVSCHLEQDYGPLAEDAPQIAHYLLEYPELYAYQQSRMKTVTNLVEVLYSIAKQHHVKLDYIPSSTALLINQSFMEGVSLNQIGSFVDRFVPLMYEDKADSIRYTIQTLRSHHEGVSVGAAFTVHHNRLASKESLVGKAKIAVEEGVDSIYYYNYTLVNERRLSWIKAANEAVDKI